MPSEGGDPLLRPQPISSTARASTASGQANFDLLRKCNLLPT